MERKSGVPHLPDSVKFTVSMAGWVGFEPTICGSAGRRLSPGSTTSPKPRTLSFPYNALTKEPRNSLINGNGFAQRSQSTLFICPKCQKREFQLTQLSEMRLLAECASCGSSFIVDTVSEKRARVEATDPNQHLVWNWKTEQWVTAKRE